MSFRYPDGKLYTTNEQPRSPIPTGSGNRGMRLEDDINESIAYYRRENIALIHKKPTPVQIVNVDYPARSRAKITEAYFRQASTTDYNGVYHGHYLDFEAKETRQKQSFPFKNFHDHQLQHLSDVARQQGCAFLIFRFVASGEIFVMKATVFMQLKAESTRKSLPKDVISENSIPVQSRAFPPIDFLPAVERLFFR
ncbi:Holliday junction resolvase RecU [Natribacillus halophilus]|uniref:Holliday junction resolvase RecU n=1 Tax=Natribacillus halophilus TaxID=549003 RepID=A0A1G8J9L4_9BACI|nr:Holliday junction resolvase RecU [Natribacillus halophilus]SDI27944.1 recombination protein U [Natribacillus halophilus]